MLLYELRHDLLQMFNQCRLQNLTSVLAPYQLFPLLPGSERLHRQVETLELKLDRSGAKMVPRYLQMELMDLPKHKLDWRVEPVKNVCLQLEVLEINLSVVYLQLEGVSG
jgi:hypothetical protein